MPVSTTYPSELGSAHTWLKADSLALSDGAAVSSWTDSSGNGRTASQATAGNQPTFKTNILNGKPVVRFDGTTDFMTVAVNAGDTYTIFMVVMLTSTAASQQLFNNGNSNGYGFSYNVPNRDMVYRAVADNLDTFNSYTAGTYEIWTGSRLTGAGAQGIFYVNGVQHLTTTGNPTTPTTNLYLGAQEGTLAFMGGDVAEFIFYTRVLTGNERANIHTYLANKYNIPVSDNLASASFKNRTLRPHPFSPGLAR